MNKGIVMELDESSIIVMRADGRFDKLPRGGRDCQVGEEILYADAKPRFKIPSMAIASGLVAAVVLCFIVFTGLMGTTANGQVVAYVTIDINPSIELGIDDKENVIDVRGLNTDGTELIASIDYKGKKLETVTAEIFTKAEQGVLSKGEGDIIISSTVVQNKATLNDEEVADKLKQQAIKHIKQSHPAQAANYEVTSFAAPQEVRDGAQEKGVSAGKYALYLNAVNNGVPVTIEQIKETSIHQIAKQNGGIDKLVSPSEPISKSNLKQLAQDEKSGKLKEKYEQAEKEKEKNNGKNSPKPSLKPTPSASLKPGMLPSVKPGSNDSKNNNDRNNNDNRNNNKSNNDKDDKKDNNDRNDDDKDNRRDGDSGREDRKDVIPSIKPSSNPTPSMKSSPTPKHSDGSDSRSDDGRNNDSKKDAAQDKKDSDRNTPNDKDNKSKNNNDKDNNDKDNKDDKVKEKVDAIKDKIDSIREKNTEGHSH